MKKLFVSLLVSFLIFSTFTGTSLAANGETVYITNSGKKYHSSGCSKLRNSKIAISIEDAMRRGYQPCKLCRSEGSTQTAKNTVQPPFAVTGISNPVPASAVSASNPAPVSALILTPEQIVQQAFALYVQAGLDQNTALQRVQAKMNDLVKQPANLTAVVQADLKALQSGSSTAKPTTEQIVQQAFARLVESGMDPAQALAAVQANLPALVAQSR